MDFTPQQYERLGMKTFYVFLLGRLGIFFAATAILIALAAAKFIWFPAIGALGTILWLGILFDALIFISSLSLAWLEYIHYSIALEEGGFKIRRGVISQEEIAIPYRRIQQVRTERNPIDQLLGVSTVIINLLGDADSIEAQDLKTRMSALDKDLASRIQDVLLKKAEIDKISMVAPKPAGPQGDGNTPIR